MWRVGSVCVSPNVRALVTCYLFNLFQHLTIRSTIDQLENKYENTSRALATSLIHRPGAGERHDQRSNALMTIVVCTMQILKQIQ